MKKTEALHPDGFRQNQHAMKMSVIRNNKQATIEYAPSVWKGWGKGNKKPSR